MASWTSRMIPNGVDTEIFNPSAGDDRGSPIALGVASGWPWHKGLKDMMVLRAFLPAHWRIVVIGVTQRQSRALPAGIEGIPRTANRSELASWYAGASVFVNPTYIDNFPTTNLEALASGTPVVTYRTGGSPEAVDEETGSVVDKGDVEALAAAVLDWGGRDRAEVTSACRQRAVGQYDANDRYSEHVDAYEQLVDA